MWEIVEVSAGLGMLVGFSGTAMLGGGVEVDVYGTLRIEDWTLGHSPRATRPDLVDEVEFAIVEVSIDSALGEIKLAPSADLIEDLVDAIIYDCGSDLCSIAWRIQSDADDDARRSYDGGAGW